MEKHDVEQHLCVVCDHRAQRILDLGLQPLANNLLDEASSPYARFPLGLSGCVNCGHAQLSHFVDPSMLFSSYIYASGTSGTLRKYFEWFADSLKQVAEPGSKVLEIACNDGSLLAALAKSGFDAIGVDPASNLTQEARAKGHKVLTGFFPDTAPEGKFDIIVAMNVAAHTPRPLRFLQGVANSLEKDGVAIIQTSQANMIANGELDTIYHEHYSFFSPSSMRYLTERADLVLDAVQLVSVHGTSFSFFLRHPGAQIRPGFPASEPFFVPWPRVPPAPFSDHFRGEVAKRGFEAFSKKANEILRQAKTVLLQRQSEGFDVALVGVAAKAMTFLGAANVKPDLYFDEAVLKCGRFVPGSSEPIRPFSEIAAVKNKTVFLIGAWNFAAEIKNKLRNIGLSGDHRVVTYFPSLVEESYGEQ
jgi:SAM-dependent methyltransferase